MNENEKARPGVEAPGQAAEEMKGFRGPVISCSQDTTGESKRQAFFIEPMLPRGSKNAVRSADLARRAGFCDVRALQQQIQRERNRGALILSKVADGGGYYRPSLDDEGRLELRRYVRTLTSRARETLKTVRSAQAALADLDGQASGQLSFLEGVTQDV